MAHVRILVVLIQMSVASHAPFPWTHDHSNLSPEQLAAHLQMCHCGSHGKESYGSDARGDESPSDELPGDELPGGRHVHYVPLEAILVGTTDGRAQSECLVADHVNDESPFVATPVWIDLSLAATESLKQAAGHGDDLVCPATSLGCELFQAYAAMRI